MQQPQDTNCYSVIFNALVQRARETDLIHTFASFKKGKEQFSGKYYIHMGQKRAN